ncbi:MAG: chromosomal replication initiator protein DnaA [Thalassobaculaceae bacterium]|nr:chromosomal replication initiator protein DnaA [Thalassobaculaceae bacterium]
MAELADRDALVAQWARVKSRLRSECGETAYRGWLKSLTLARRDGQVIYLAIPSKFERDRVVTQYGDRLRGLWQGEDPAIASVEVVASGRLEVAQRQVGAEDRADRPMASFAVPEYIAAEPPSDLDAISAPLDARFTFDNFVVGKPNELAFAAARRVAESETVPFNPLFLYGGVGLGKTHLMHAIAWEIRKNHPQRRVLYLSAEKFMYQFIRALRYRDTVAFKDLFRSVDVLMIDDVQFISGKDSTQEEFFHTFNALVDNNRQVVISADKSPTNLDGMEERLRSRLGWGLVADIHPTDYELRLGILQSKVERVDVDIPPKVMEFLSHKISSNVRELEGALNRVVAHSTLVGRAITLEMVQEVLADILKANDRRVTIEEIQRQVASHYNIRISDMYSARRARAIARPRQIAMYLSKQLTQRSLPEIGRKFGGRDHTTVMHAVKKVDELRATDRHFDADVDLLRRMLEG